MPTYRIIPETMEQVRDDMLKLQLQMCGLVNDALARGEKSGEIALKSGLDAERIEGLRNTLITMGVLKDEI